MPGKLLVLSDTAGKASHRHLAGTFDVYPLDIDHIAETEPQPRMLVDVDLRSRERLMELSRWLRRKPKHSKIVFAVDRDSRLQETQALALGATDVVHRPLHAADLIGKFWGEFDVLAADDPGDPLRSVPGVGAAIDALQRTFAFAYSGEPLDAGVLNAAGETLASQIESGGLASFVDTVRRHHSQTYQHSLLVTGLSVAFGQHLGVSRADVARLAFGGLLHDIGKVHIPVTILEKPGPLTPDEIAVVRNHPEFGLSALKGESAIATDMLDTVIYHHELLDGSGYPRGLRGGEIPDLVRIMTICDIFGALIERRSYKPPLPGKVAYDMLRDMGPKLDRDLVREFRFVSSINFDS